MKRRESTPVVYQVEILGVSHEVKHGYFAPMKYHAVFTSWVGLSLPTVAQGQSDGRQAFQVSQQNCWEAFHYYPSRKKMFATEAQ